ncbi:MAG: hydrogenase 4 subunit F [Planctomycetes bacterium]|nr:hydrogenase 4 subunit F [Planctomycetota bacterium]
MSEGWLLWALLGWPVAGILPCLALRSPRVNLGWTSCVVVAQALLASAVIRAVWIAGSLRMGPVLFVDALSAFHLGVMMIVFVTSTLFAPSYFRHAIESGEFTPWGARRYAALWLGALAAMTLVLLSDNLGLMWVGVEATTLLTAMLIYVHRTPASLEAMWKYLLICSVGVAFAFMGTLLVAAAGRGTQDALTWTHVRKAAGMLDANTLKLGFLFLLVGYGTKAGLAPMHSWLPDAHSQAPAPVSGLFSGFMLSAALYCIMRYVPIVEAATGGTGWSLRLLTFFGVASILVAGAFIVSQRDVKRLLAYSSVEHLGIVALGIGLGKVGLFAALFHTLNHALGKTLAFLCAGRLGQHYGTYDMTRMQGALRASPLWGAGLMICVLALLGAAPFGVFVSEFLIVKAAVEARATWTLVLLLTGLAIIFIGALRHVIGVVYGLPPATPAARRPGPVEVVLVVLPLAALLVLGLWMPDGLRRAIEEAAAVVGGKP